MIFDFSAVEGYEKLSNDNFVIGLTNVRVAGPSNVYAGGNTVSQSYDSITGILTVTFYATVRTNDETWINVCATCIQCK